MLIEQFSLRHYSTTKSVSPTWPERSVTAGCVDFAHHDVGRYSIGCYILQYLKRTNCEWCVCLPLTVLLPYFFPT